jgi:hypothetical protein
MKCSSLSYLVPPWLSHFLAGTLSLLLAGLPTSMFDGLLNFDHDNVLSDCHLTLSITYARKHRQVHRRVSRPSHHTGHPLPDGLLRDRVPPQASSLGDLGGGR